jgi:hypothetical protein
MSTCDRYRPDWGAQAAVRPRSVCLAQDRDDLPFVNLDLRIRSSCRTRGREACQRMIGPARRLPDSEGASKPMKLTGFAGSLSATP